MVYNMYRTFQTCSGVGNSCTYCDPGLPGQGIAMMTIPIALWGSSLIRRSMEEVHCRQPIMRESAKSTVHNQQLYLHVKWRLGPVTGVHTAAGWPTACFALPFILHAGCITSLFLSLLSPLFHSHFLLLCPLPCQTVPRTRRAVSWWSLWFCVDVFYSGNACYHYYALLLYLYSYCFLVCISFLEHVFTNLRITLHI